MNLVTKYVILSYSECNDDDDDFIHQLNPCQQLTTKPHEKKFMKINTCQWINRQLY